MKTPEQIAEEQSNEVIAAALAARCGKPVSRFFRNEARRLAKPPVNWTEACRSPKEERDAAALKREYRSDRR